MREHLRAQSRLLCGLEAVSDAIIGSLTDDIAQIRNMKSYTLSMVYYEIHTVTTNTFVMQWRLNWWLTAGSLNVASCIRSRERSDWTNWDYNSKHMHYLLRLYYGLLSHRTCTVFYCLFLIQVRFNIERMSSAAPHWRIVVIFSETIKQDILRRRAEPCFFVSTEFSLKIIGD